MDSTEIQENPGLRLNKIPIHSRLMSTGIKKPRVRNKNLNIDYEFLNTDSSQSTEDVVPLPEPEKKLTLIERAVGYFNAENDKLAQNSALNLSVNNGPPFICTVCDNWFYMGSKLKLHYILNHNLFHCEVCSILFESIDEKNLHTSNYHQPIFCEICQNYKENIHILLQHYEIDHDSSTCPFCGILLQPRNMAKNHLIRKHSVHQKYLENSDKNIIAKVEGSHTEFFCALCNKNREIDIFFGHMNSHHKLNIASLLNLIVKYDVTVFVNGAKKNEVEGDKDEEKIYKNSCQVCLLRFTKKIPKDFHLVYCQSRIQCKFCEKSFTNTNLLKTHMKKAHTKFHCRQGCTNLAYNTEENLYKHYLKVHEAIGCRYCNIYINLTNLDEHFETNHKYKAIIMKNFNDSLFEVTEKENKHIVICCLCDENITLLAEKIKDIFQHYTLIHSVTYNKLLQLIGSKPLLEDYDDFYREINEQIKTEDGQSKFVPEVNIKVEPREMQNSEEEEEEEQPSGDDDDHQPKLVKKYVDYSYLQDEIQSDIDFDETQIIINSDSELEDENTEFICEFCDQKEQKLINLTKHIESKHKFKVKLKKINCKYCKNESISYKTHSNHLIQHHGAQNFDFSKEIFNCTCENYKVVHSLARWHVLKVHDGDLQRYNVEDIGLKCRFCEKYFWERNEINEHELKEHFKDNVEDFQKCSQCDNIFSSQKLLSIHSKTHENFPTYSNLIYKCLNCYLVYPTLSLLREHFRSEHPNSKIFKCPLDECPKLCKKKKYMICHLQRPHERDSKEMEAFCDVCGKKFKSFKAATIHKLMKHQRDRAGFQCRICNERFTTSEQRKLHYTTAHPGQLAYNCLECGKGFISKSGLYGHKKTHQENNNMICPYCSKEFSRRDSYNEHLLIHIGPRHQCPHCPKSFTQRSNLTRHVRIHTGAKPYQCCYCEKRFSDRGACRSHERVHTKEEHCECSYCGKKFTKKQKLKYHLRYHTGEGLLDCETCGKQFSNTYSLNEHKRIHNSDTLLMCSCGRGFSTEKYLNRHMQTVHKQAATKYICPICFKPLYQKSSYNAHIMTHSAVKHVRCLLCNKEYNTRKTVKRHIQEEHNLRGNPEIVKHIYQLTPQEAGLNLPPASEMAIKIGSEQQLMNMGVRQLQELVSTSTAALGKKNPEVEFAGDFDQVCIKEEPASDIENNLEDESNDSDDEVPLSERLGKKRKSK